MRSLSTNAINVMERFIHEYPGFGKSGADVRALFRVLRAAFPDLRVEVHAQFLDGDGQRVHQQDISWDTSRGVRGRCANGESGGDPGDGFRAGERWEDA